jgi:MFS family permease
MEPAQKKGAFGLAVFFGIVYFVQGVGEPTAGLIAQPTMSLLRRWELTPGEVATFLLLLGLPWSIKPLFGLISDFIPILGSRRKIYLLTTTFATIVGLLAAWALELPKGASNLLLLLLVIPTIGVAFSDVVADALMIEKGKPLGITGRLQSVQWAALYGAGILTGVLGGWLSQNNLEERGFLICGLLTCVTLVCTFVFVREDPWKGPRPGLGDAFYALWTTARSPAVLGVGGFLFLWNFNPFSTNVLYEHVTTRLGLSEQFYGYMSSVQSVTSIFACLLYGAVGHRFKSRALIHASIALGIMATLLYWAVEGEVSALIVSAAVGFTYMLASIIQLDLAARACTAETAGTTFAILMSLCNLSVSLSVGLGGTAYEQLNAWQGPDRAFQVLVLIGAVFTAGCWPLMWIAGSTFKDLLAPPAVIADWSKGAAAGDKGEVADWDKKA